MYVFRFAQLLMRGKEIRIEVTNELFFFFLYGGGEGTYLFYVTSFFFFTQSRYMRESSLTSRSRVSTEEH